MSVDRNISFDNCIEAARTNDVTVLQRSIAENSNAVNCRDDYGFPPLIIAAVEGHLDAVITLLDATGIEVDACNEDHPCEIKPALLWATAKGHTPVVRRLIAAGANLEARAKPDQDTALTAAARSGNPDIVQLLIDANANVNASNRFGYTALIFAASNGYTDTLVRLLATHKINVNARNIDGCTALMCAAESGYRDIVKILLAFPGIELTAKDKNGLTAEALANKQKHPKIADLIAIAINKDKLQRCLSDNCSRFFHTHFPLDISVLIRSYLAGEDTAPKPKDFLA